jgi:hypothetical protein
MLPDLTSTFVIEIGVLDIDEPSVADLLTQSENYAYSLYPPESVHMLARTELKASHVRFIVTRDKETSMALGCCALVLQPDFCAEIKRMFVQAPNAMRAAIREKGTLTKRRRGVGAALMQAVEAVASKEGVKTLRFETGPEQPHAVALGHRFGYQICGPFGGYQDDPNSVFMVKNLI